MAAILLLEHPAQEAELLLPEGQREVRSGLWRRWPRTAGESLLDVPDGIPQHGRFESISVSVSCRDGTRHPRTDEIGLEHLRDDSDNAEEVGVAVVHPKPRSGRGSGVWIVLCGPIR